MKKYIAIGHFEESDETTCVAESTTTMRAFRTDLQGNGFKAYVVMTEKRMDELKDMDSFDIFKAVEKMTSNYRKWDDVADYIYQCADIIEDRVARA